MSNVLSELLTFGIIEQTLSKLKDEKNISNSTSILTEEKDECAEKVDKAIENLEYLKNDTITKETD